MVSPKTGPYSARSEALAFIDAASSARLAAVSYSAWKDEPIAATSSPRASTQAGIITRSRRSASLNSTPVPAR